MAKKNFIPVDGYAEFKRIFGAEDVEKVLTGNESGIPWDVMKRTPSNPEIIAYIMSRMPVLLMCQPHGQKRRYRCTACDADYTIGGPDRIMTPEMMELYQCRHNDQAQCPKCGMSGKVVFAAKWNLKKHWSWKPFVFEYIPQGGKEAYFFHVDATRTLHESELYGFTQRLDIHVTGVDIAARGMMMRYSEWFYDKKYHCNRVWMQSHGKAIGKGGFSDPWAKAIYSDTSYSIAPHPESAGRIGSFLQYMPGKISTGGDPLAQVAAFAVFPSAEMLYKAGAKDLCDQLVYRGNRNARVIDLCGQDARGVFRGLSNHAIKTYLSRYGDHHGSDRYLYGFQQLRGLYHTDEECFDGVWAMLHEITPDNYISFICTLRDLKIRPEKLIEYLHSKEHKTSGSKSYGIGIYAVYYYWEDYIKAAKGAKLDLSRHEFSLPKNLVKRHDDANRIYNRILMERKDRALEKITEKYTEMYAFSEGDYTVVIPQSTQAIVLEGKLQEHCVAGYADRHAAGKLAIVFVRKKDAPTIPLVTVEMRDEVMWQARGKKNRTLTEGENAFVLDWLCEVGCRMKKQPFVFGNPNLNKKLSDMYAIRMADDGCQIRKGIYDGESKDHQYHHP